MGNQSPVCTVSFWTDLVFLVFICSSTLLKLPFCGKKIFTMAAFAAKYIVSSATSGVTGRVGELSGDLGKQLSMENLSKKDLERAEKELNKEEKARKKKHYQMEASRQKLRSDIRGKYGIKKRRAHEPVETHTGILMPRSEKELLLAMDREEEEEDDCICSPCCSWIRLCCPCLFKGAKHS